MGQAFEWRKPLREEARDEPGDAAAEDGTVVLRCAGDLLCKLTPDAAVITSDRLFRAGIAAKIQQRQGSEPAGE